MGSVSLVKRTIEYQKAAFDAGYNTMVILQGQAEQLASDFWAQSQTPPEGIKAFESTVNECKKGRDNLKKMVDEGFERVESFFTS